ncbi:MULTISPECIES: hypothetical protein [Streptomyces]|uniref:Uncharacterized protein n=4 Tax=Streptomyces TaxID=1883 RepID=A0A6A0CRJ8_9ACTN|nr:MULTISPECIES: hypothetical protein [Streptomyces]NEE38927.1 hypothetical protein [Streptomyces sp. SID7982]MDQ0295148.1 hypothetical protein [Streptomyces sp. DSM 41037]PJM84638.1 hypothetical protein CH313_01170 [Streptomyces sp. TSRI0384-2]QNE81501.1 hypothetical protein F0345_10565 [Streptomyces rutgersensis]RPK91492.1 hypothetical protein EES47_05645 [Streptomyces sp. ADI98-12]
MPYIAWHPRTRRPLVVLTRSGAGARVRLVHSDTPFEVPVPELQHYPWAADPHAPPGFVAVLLDTPHAVREGDWVVVVGCARRVRAQAACSAGSRVLELEGYGKWVLAAPRVAYRRPSAGGRAP